METQDFLKLDMKQVMEWVSSDDITVSAEEEVFKGIVKLVSHNKSEREGDFPDLLHQVRLASVSNDFLLNKLVKEELITKNAEFCLSFVLNELKLLSSASGWQVEQQPRKCLDTHVIFVCGGRKALCYFPKQNEWHRLADTPFHYRSHTLVQHKDKIYIFTDDVHKLGESQVMEYYVPNANSWGSVQRVPKSCNSCTVLKGNLYALYFSHILEERMYRYVAETHCWDQMDAPPTARHDPCVVADDQHMYVIGGFREKHALSTTTKFDPSKNKWEEVATLTEARYSACGAAMNGKIYTVGGKQYSSTMTALSSCEVFNPSTNEWQPMAGLKVPRCSASMVCCEGKLYVLGGSTNTQSSTTFQRLLTVEEFDSKRNEWMEISVIPVKSFETLDEQKKKNNLQACFARFCKEMIDKFKPLN